MQISISKQQRLRCKDLTQGVGNLELCAKILSNSILCIDLACTRWICKMTHMKCHYDNWPTNNHDDEAAIYLCLRWAAFWGVAGWCSSRRFSGFCGHEKLQISQAVSQFAYSSAVPLSLLLTLCRLDDRENHFARGHQLKQYLISRLHIVRFCPQPPALQIWGLAQWSWWSPGLSIQKGLICRVSPDSKIAKSQDQSQGLF